MWTISRSGCAAIVVVVFSFGCAAKQKTTPGSEPSPTLKARPPGNPPEPEGRLPAAAPISIQPIYFTFDSATLEPDAREMLAKVGEHLRSNPGASLTVSGHADERGTTEYNLALGHKRAQSAQEYLVRLGVEAARLKVVSYGEERPLVAGDTEDAWAKNRRDEFEFDYPAAAGSKNREQ